MYKLKVIINGEKFCFESHQDYDLWNKNERSSYKGDPKLDEMPLLVIGSKCYIANEGPNIHLIKEIVKHRNKPLAKLIGGRTVPLYDCVVECM